MLCWWHCSVHLGSSSSYYTFPMSPKFIFTASYPSTLPILAWFHCPSKPVPGQVSPFGSPLGGSPILDCIKYKRQDIHLAKKILSLSISGRSRPLTSFCVDCHSLLCSASEKANWLHCRRQSNQLLLWGFSHLCLYAIFKIVAASRYEFTIWNHVDHVGEENFDGIRYLVNVVGGVVDILRERCPRCHFRRLEKPIYISNYHRSIRQNGWLDYLCV